MFNDRPSGATSHSFITQSVSRADVAANSSPSLCPPPRADVRAAPTVNQHIIAQLHLALDPSAPSAQLADNNRNARRCSAPVRRIVKKIVREFVSRWLFEAQNAVAAQRIGTTIASQYQVCVVVPGRRPAIRVVPDVAAGHEHPSRAAERRARRVGLWSKSRAKRVDTRRRSSAQSSPKSTAPTCCVQGIWYQGPTSSR